MKKNFFKKLSFVMALAMIISVIAPAAGALAATGLRLNATSKTLMLGENNTYNFNALGKTAGATEKWTTSNAKIAAVNAKNGVVTAKAVGKATITATVTNAKKTVTKKLTAKVTVGDSIKSLSVVAPANAADLAKLEVGTDYDFNRTFETMGGSKTKTSNITIWFVNDAPATLAKAGEADGATIDTAGVFKAENAGEYTITARAFRYKAQYEAWVKAGSNADDTKYIKASDSVKVTVLNDIKEVKQTTTNKFTVEFVGAVKAEDLTVDKASVAQVVNGKDMTTGAERIKSITLDSTGTVATVELYADFIAKSTYKFVYGDMTGTFIAASKDLAEVKGIIFDDLTVNVTTNTGKDVLDIIYAVNADGVKILTGSEIASYLSFEVANSELTKGYVDATGKAYIYGAGNSITAKAIYTNYVYNTTDKKYDSVSLSDSAVITGVSSDIDAATMQYAVTTASSHPATLSSAWTSPISVFLGEATFGAPYNIYVRYKKTTDSSADDYKYDATSFTYVSTDPSKLTISGTTLFPVALGTVTVIVKSLDGQKVLGNFDVTINPERVLTTATATGTVTVGNNLLYGEVGRVSITVLDNLGSGMRSGEVTATVSSDIQPVSVPQNGSGVGSINFTAVSSPVQGQVFVSFDARGSRAGYYQYTIKVKDTTTKGDIYKDVVFGINVVESNFANTAVASYAPVFEDGGATTKDANVVDVNTNKSYSVNVYGLNNNGFRVTQLTAGTDYTAEIKLGTSTITGPTLDIATVTGGALGSGGYLEFLDTGVYTLTAKAAATNTIGKATNAPLGASSFNLTDTHVKAAVVVAPSVKKTATVMTIAEVLDKALDVTVTAKDNVARVDFINNPGDVVQIVGVYQTSVAGNISLSSNVTSQTYLYIEKIVVAVDVDGAGGSAAKKLHTINVGKSISIQ